MAIKSILYDLDGVLLDCVQLHFEALNMALQEVAGTSINCEEEAIFNGLPTKLKLQMLNKMDRIVEDDYDLIFSKKQEYTKIAIMKYVFNDHVKINLHKYTSELGISSACVTNSITETAKLMLERSGQLNYMKFVISNEMVKRPKPHGEGYITAMIRLGVLPSEVLIVEDSDKGIIAAKSTGANILVVKNATQVTIDIIKEAIKNNS